MNKEKRAGYLALISEIGSQMCMFCKYAQSYGCDSGPECEHPLKDFISHPGYDFLDTDTDCWAFRPAYSIQDAADIVGIALSEGYDEWGFHVNSKGQIKVFGRKLAQEATNGTN